MANIAKIIPYRQNNDPALSSREKGSSNGTHLTASLIIRKAQNLEGQAFIKENYPQKFTQTPNPKGRQKGQIIQKGLTKRGKKVIRIVSDCYGLLVQDKDFREKRDPFGNYTGSSCRFITLTFRNIIPSDTEAKKLLDNFFKRLARLFGRSVHYLWVAEIQQKRFEKTGVRAIHFHILTPENISGQLAKGKNLSNQELRLLENTWVNRAWNETVKNWSLSSGKITKNEAKQWQNEYDLSESYYKSKIKFQIGLNLSEPRKPAKSKFLLLPNLVHVFKAGNYMRKYMSKEGQNIVGGMYGASQKSRDFLEMREVCDKKFGAVLEANEVVKFMEMRAEQEKVYVATWILDHNEARGIWCADVYRLQEWYFEFLALQKYKEKQKVPETINAQLSIIF